MLTEAGHEVLIASIKGGEVPIDPESLGKLVIKLGGTDQRYESQEFMDLLAHTSTVAAVADQNFDAIYLTGGHGTMFDFVDDAALAGLIQRLDADGKVVAAVCHGPAGLLHVLRGDGTPLLKGRKVTEFSWPEEKLAGRDQVVPCRLDHALEGQGAKYTKALRPMASKVCRRQPRHRAEPDECAGRRQGRAETAGQAVRPSVTSASSRRR